MVARMLLAAADGLVYWVLVTQLSEQDADDAVRAHLDEVLGSAWPSSRLRVPGGALRLDDDPLAPAGRYYAGQSLLEYLDERDRANGLDRDLVDKLVNFYRRAMVH